MISKPPRPLMPPATPVLLHSCCAPCSCAIMADLKEAGIPFTVFYDNPNVHPAAEYERRKAENQRYAQKLGVDIIEGDYDPKAWFARIKGLEDEPERGKRCQACFAFRLERTAHTARAHGFPVFATSLGISRMKNQAQVYEAGRRAASALPGLVFWDIDWRKGGRGERGAALSRQESFYRQSYCGCVFSQTPKPCLPPVPSAISEGEPEPTQGDTAGA